MTIPTHWDQPELPTEPVQVAPPETLNGKPEDNWARTDKYRYWLRQLSPAIVFKANDMARWTGDSIKATYNTMQQLFASGELRRVGGPASGQYSVTASLKQPSGRTVRVKAKDKPFKKAPVPKIRVKKPKATNDVFEIAGNVGNVTVVRNIKTHEMYALKELVLK